jgi:hypothetical protein
MEAIEHQLLGENSALAMNLMVLEAKIRGRFQAMEHQVEIKYPLEEPFINEDMTLEEIQALIPKELPLLPTAQQTESSRRRKRTIETVGLAAVFALVTAFGVFGLASILQLALSWVA